MKRSSLTTIFRRTKNLPYELGLNNNIPKLLTVGETLDLVIDENKSLARFGDGEFNILFGSASNFEAADPILTQKLSNCLDSNLPNLIVGLPDIFGNLSVYQPRSRNYWRDYLLHNRARITEQLDLTKMYGNSMVTRTFLKNKVSDKQVETIFNRWKRLWQGRNVVFVQGSGDIFGYSSDLFDNAIELGRVIGPEKNAFYDYSTLLSQVSQYKKDTLVLISLGATATVMAAELAQSGYQAVDIGHLHNDYRHYLRHTKGEPPI